MQAGLDLALDYTHDRKQFGVKIGTFQLMQGKLAGKPNIPILPTSSFISHLLSVIPIGLCAESTTQA